MGIDIFTVNRHVAGWLLGCFHSVGMGSDPIIEMLVERIGDTQGIDAGLSWVASQASTGGAARWISVVALALVSGDVSVVEAYVIRR